MFAGVRGRAKGKQESMEKKKTVTLAASIIRCPNCGGPRLDESVFSCEFCGLKFGATDDNGD